jgi:hypothetical protein
MITNSIIQSTTCPPIWGPGSEWFWAFAQFVVVALTLGVICYQVWSQTEQAKIQAAGSMAQTVCLIQDKWNTDTMQRMRLKICSDWKSNKKNFDGVCEYVAEFFEELATFVKIGAISKEVMWDVQSWNIECYWSMFKDEIYRLRAEYKDESFYEGFEELFDDIGRINKQRTVPMKCDNDINDFIEREIRSTTAALDIKTRH